MHISVYILDSDRIELAKYSTCYKKFDFWPANNLMTLKIKSSVCIIFLHFSSQEFYIKKRKYVVFVYAFSVRYCFYGQLLPLSGRKKLLIMN